MTGQGEQTQKYAAFMSYAHADEGIAGRLHQALETYRLPKAFRAAGEHPLKPIFRDVADLTVHHSLSDKIRDAVAGSRCMIVLCSPAAKNSHWVNEEIRYFRELHGDDNIFSVMASGSPATAFPEALTEGGREPLAADISGNKADFRLGVTQIAAAMLGTGLDDLVRRDEKRRTRRLQTAMLASLVFSGAMAAATLTAVDAKKEAEASRNDAEGLVEYMITDLKDKLEPVGRLDILDGVGERAVAYYDRQGIKDLPDESLTRQARARHVLGQVALDAGRMEDAQREIEKAAVLTKEVLERNPEDTNAIFAHAQSEYWIGAVYYKQDEFDSAVPPWTEYNRLAQSLYQVNPKNFKWIMEAAWGANNLGALTWQMSEFGKADFHFVNAIDLFEKAIVIRKADKNVQRELSNTLIGHAQVLLLSGDIVQALNQNRRAILLQENLLNKYKDDKNLHYSYILSLQDLVSNFSETLLRAEKSSYYEKIISGTEYLVFFDPLNEKWKNTLVEVLYDDFLLSLNEGQIQKANDNYEKLKNLSVNDEKHGSNLALIRMKCANVIINYKRNNEISQIMLKLNNEYENLQASVPKETVVDFLLMEMNSYIGNKEKAKVFAEKYLSYSWTSNNVTHPKLISRKKKASRILRDAN